MKSIVITGVSTGIGYGATVEFLNSGYQVFGSVRTKEDADKLSQQFGQNFVPMIFDVTDYAAIYKAAEEVKTKIKGTGLTALISNAGAAEGGPLMHLPIDIFQRHLDILVTGQLVTIQAFLPLLGAQENYPHKPGRIMTISSISGAMASPFLGAYVAAKHALEGISKTLQIELQIYGIDVIIVGPGLVKTKIWDKMTDDLFEKYRHTHYYDSYKYFVSFFKKAIPNEALELDDFSKTIRQIIESQKPKTRYSLVKNKFKNWTLPRLLSQRTQAKVMAKMFQFKNQRVR
jgi:NAD(P)-dependent dehydrogenase (short-subunit alcohol dehydrogenase family)